MAASSAGRLDGGQRGDRIDGLGGPLLAVQRPAAADDPEGLGRVREGQAGGHGGDLHGAPLRAPVAPFAGGMSDRDLAPGQLSELGVQAGLVGLDGEQVMRAALGDQVLRWARWACMASAVTTALATLTWSSKVANMGDLVRFGLHGCLSQDRAMSVIERGQQMPARTAGQP